MNAQLSGINIAPAAVSGGFRRICSIKATPRAADVDHRATGDVQNSQADKDGVKSCHRCSRLTVGLAQTRLPEGERRSATTEDYANQRIFHRVVQPHQVQAVINNGEEQHAADGAGTY